MPDTALLCFDGSDSSRAAIREASKVLSTRTAVVATAWEPVQTDRLAGSVPGLGGVLRQGIREMDQIAAEGARRTAEEGAQLAHDLDFEAEAVAVEARGAIFSALVDLARERGVAVIVCGTRGQSTLAAAILGSVSTGLLHHAPCPVLVVPSLEAP
jgi:nucleotide-binding universal stress UspA family protein